jgi:predicted TPR repeat methyltransferase
VLAAWEQAALVGDPDGLVEQEGADVEYVRSLFGAVAETYDASAARRRYAAPARVAAAVAALVGPTRRLGDVLDLGCGTGLSGAALRAVPGLFGGRLVGVEAVPEMLEAAQAKTTLYDATVSGEAAEELAEVLASGRLYDLVAAVDVLPYVRDVAPVLEGAAAVLGRRGLLAVTVDLPQQEDGGGASEGDADFDLEWTLLRDGRFAHGPSMVLRIAVRAGLAPVAKERVVLRHERGRPVVGLVLVFQKLVAEDDGSDGAAGGVDWTTRAPVPAAPAGGGGLVIE